MSGKQSTKVQLTCETCHVTFFEYRCKLKPRGNKTGQFCGNACRRRAITLTCQTCSKEFQKIPSALKQPGRGRFCSIGCYADARRVPAEIRFRQQTAPANANGCIIWTGQKDRAGYGRIGIVTNGRWRGKAAHRFAWELAHGTIPDGLFVCHRCDIPACVAPDHLFLGTAADNSADMVSKGRAHLGDKHGLRLHPEAILRGSRSHFAKLTEADVRAIRELIAEGASDRSIAHMYAVCAATIYAIRAGLNWKHVPFSQ